jgi:hypothetical protein
VNLALLQLPVMLVVYKIYYELIDSQEETVIAHNVDEVGISVITVVMCFCMALLSYDDELILFY